MAKFIALQIKKHNLVPENTPHSVAAGIIYLLSVEFNLSITTKQIHDISDTSEVTINKCYKKIDAVKSLLIPPGLYAKYKSP